MTAILSGPYDLCYEVLDKALPMQRGGVFAIGHVDAKGTFRVQRVGRDTLDLRERLRSMIGSGNNFKYAMASTALEAFEIECDLFHKFRPPGNFTHPDRPPGSGWKCRHCLQLHV